MPVRVPELTTRIDHPPQSCLAVTLPLGRNTGLAILKDAGIQCRHGTSSTEAAARTVDAA